MTTDAPTNDPLDPDRLYVLVERPEWAKTPPAPLLEALDLLAGLAASWRHSYVAELAGHSAVFGAAACRDRWSAYVTAHNVMLKGLVEEYAP